MLEPAGGAAATVPSTNVLLASPQPTASTGAPPTDRRTSAPPVAANPPEYAMSAMDPYTPELLASRRRWPGSSGRGSVHAALRVTVDPLEVTYTTSSPARSTGAGPALTISTNSSLADEPPVTTSERRSVDGLQETDPAIAAAGTVPPSGPGRAAGAAAKL